MRLSSCSGKGLVLALIASFIISEESAAQITAVTDIAPETGFQDTQFGHYRRGRAAIAADFDLDGRTDYYIGNPGDESYVLRNVSGANGLPSFVLSQVLLVDSLAWGGVALDYDNDGDYDLFIACGGNEGIGYDFLFRNDWIMNGVASGELTFTDVTEIAGVAGPMPDSNALVGPGQVPRFIEDDCSSPSGHSGHAKDLPRARVYPPRGETLLPVRTASAGAVVADYDQDGDDDIFVNGNLHGEADPNYPELIGRNTLWRNNGDGTFTDVTVDAGLAGSLRPTRHSTFLDYDNDGDADLYENNMSESNILWRNNGDGTFTDVTSEASMPGHDLHYPRKSFVSAAADLNNDGWEDIICFMRGPGAGQEFYEDGHALFLNRGGIFENVAAATIINDAYIGENGVMGSMVGDVSGDGLPDIYVGNGGPPEGIADQFYTSLSGADSLEFTDNTSLIDFPAVPSDSIPVPVYPYRTHGTTFVDVDNDGLLEIAVVNGGPAGNLPDYEEPDRLFKIETATPYNWIKVRPVGDGVTVPLDAAGTRIAVEVSRDGGTPWSVYRTLFAGSAFSAQNGFEAHFGLADADTIHSIALTWSNGTQTVVNQGIPLNTSIVVGLNGILTSIHEGESSPSGEQAPSSPSLGQNHPNPFNSSTTISVDVREAGHVAIWIYDVLGREITTLVDEDMQGGYFTRTWDGKNNTGQQVASGIYVYRLTAGSYSATKRMLLLR